MSEAIHGNSDRDFKNSKMFYAVFTSQLTRRRPKLYKNKSLKSCV